MKNKLIKFLNQINEQGDNERIADYLIENGVHCPPCKIGDYIKWRNECGDIVFLEITGFDFDKTGNAVKYHTKYSDIQPFIGDEDVIGIIPKEKISQEIKPRGRMIKYSILRKVGNEWYYWGEYTNINALVRAACELVKFYSAEDIKVEVVEDET